MWHVNWIRGVFHLFRFSKLVNEIGLYEFEPKEPKPQDHSWKIRLQSWSAQSQQRLYYSNIRFPLEADCTNIDLGEPVEAERGNWKKCPSVLLGESTFYENSSSNACNFAHHDVTHDLKTSPHVFYWNIRSVTVKHLTPAWWQTENILLTKNLVKKKKSTIATLFLVMSKTWYDATTWSIL